VTYLCGPITDVADDGVSWRKEINEPLAERFGLTVSDPTKELVQGLGEIGAEKKFWRDLIKERKLDEVKEKFWKIVHKDLRAVDRADFLIFRYIPKARMLGTVHELVVAQMQKKPILMVIKEEELDELNPWVLTYIKKGCIFHSFEELFAYLDEIDKGKFNNSYWSL
jgi:nucleoside 2-deoxyribosyltransferase